MFKEKNLSPKQLAALTALLLSSIIGISVFVFCLLARKWFKYSSRFWIECETPVLTINFAGIGTREIDEYGIRAIEDVYNKTFNIKKAED